MSTQGEQSERKQMESIIEKLSQYLQKPDHEQAGLRIVLKEIDKTLESKHSRDLFFSALAPLLFESPSSSENLLVATMLVNHNPSSYTLPASRAVRSFTEKLVDGQELCVTDDLLNTLISQFSLSTQISENITYSLVSLARHSPPLLERIFEKVCYKWTALLERIGTSSQNKKDDLMMGIRFASLLSLSIVNIGDISFRYLKSTEALDHFVQLIQVTINEPLDHVVLLEQCLEPILSQIENESCSKGVEWVFSSGLLNELLSWTASAFDEDSLFKDLYVPTLLRSIASLASTMTPEQRESFQEYVQTFATEVTGEQGRLNFLNVVCPWASSSKDTLESILSNDTILKTWLCMKFISQSKLKSAMMTSLAQVMRTVRDSPNDGGAIALRSFAQWGRMNDRNASELLLEMVKSPLIEIRLGAYELMKVVVTTGAGAQIMVAEGGCIEFLLFPGIENTKEGFEAKWEILKGTLNSPVKSLLAEDVVVSLEKRRDQGPYPPSMRRDVATE